MLVGIFEKRGVLNSFAAVGLGLIITTYLEKEIVKLAVKDNKFVLLFKYKLRNRFYEDCRTQHPEILKLKYCGTVQK